MPFAGCPKCLTQIANAIEKIQTLGLCVYHVPHKKGISPVRN